MLQLKNVLITTDFSRYSREGREFAWSLCSRFQARLHLLHVIHDRPSDLSEAARRLVESGSQVSHRHEIQRDNAEVRMWGWMFPHYKKKHEIRFAARFGHPLTEIVQYARDEAIDLIIIGTHGRTGWEHLLHGSIAEQLVRTAPCPVLSVKPHADETLGSSEQARHVVNVKEPTSDGR